MSQPLGTPPAKGSQEHPRSNKGPHPRTNSPRARPPHKHNPKHSQGAGGTWQYQTTGSSAYSSQLANQTYPDYNSDSHLPPPGSGNGSGQHSRSENETTEHHSHPSKNSRRRKQDKSRSTSAQVLSGMPAADGTSSPRTAGGHAAKPSYDGTATPTKQAYAGPTFHASPAASALPIPKFFSKSVPAAAPSVLQAKLEEDPNLSESSSPEHERSNSVKPEKIVPAREESPLDFFFDAQRAEQERQRSTDSLPAKLRSSLPPGSAPRAFQGTPTRQTPTQYQGRAASRGYTSEKATFMMELDGSGEGETSDENTPSMPFKDRLNAVRTPSGLSQSQSTAGSDDEELTARSDALKKILKIQEQPSELPATSSMPPTRQPPPQTAWPRSNAPTSTGPSELPGSPVPATQQNTYPPQAAQQPSDVKSMEMELRKLLKLDQPGHPGGT